MPTPSTHARLRLVLVPGLGPVLQRRLIEMLGSPEAAAAATPRQLRQIQGIGPKKAEAFARALGEADPDVELRRAADIGSRVVDFDDDEYPAALRHIHDPPAVLFVRGVLQRQDALALAVVGSRRCSAYGAEQAARLSGLCAQAGLCIASGGALGIDAAAHRAAMRAGGRTLAVLGCGLGVTYPPGHGPLYTAIAEQGALISELPTDAPPLAEHFPRRNRIISGLSLGVLVIEADRRSGAMITARLAAEEHHREVMALPGRVDARTSQGCHQMIREGWATLVSNPGEILDTLGAAGRTLKKAMTEAAAEADSPPDAPSEAMPENRRRVLSAIDGQATEIDTVCARSGLTVGTVQSHLLTLEMAGLIERLPANRVRRRGAPGPTPESEPLSQSGDD